MIFTDKLIPKPYHYFTELYDSGLRGGERLDGIIIWERVVWPKKGYYWTKNTWRNRLRYRLYRIGGWLAWRECDLMDEIITHLRLHGFEGVTAGWKDIWFQLLRGKK